MHETVLAYYAGFFDAEGWVGFDGKGHSLQVKISNTDLELLIELWATFGGRLHKINAKYVGAQECWQWTIQGTKARDFLLQLLPFLRQKKIKAWEHLNTAQYREKAG